VRILVVDDDAVMRNIFSLMLQRAGFDVDAAADGLVGVEMWEHADYDLVLMDVQMPRMNGFEATHSIREMEQSRGGHTPIVAVTAFALANDKEKCLAAGMDAYLSKPIDFKKCIDLVQSLSASGT
jgi:CheY-like chemotaxis protein